MGTQHAAVTWWRWVEPWYLVYALLGATMGGLVPILLPLLVSRAASAAHVGLVMAALSLGGLTAPLWGNLADRCRLHRWLLTGGLSAIAVGLGTFALALSLAMAIRHAADEALAPPETRRPAYVNRS